MVHVHQKGDFIRFLHEETQGSAFKPVLLSEPMTSSPKQSSFTQHTYGYWILDHFNSSVGTGFGLQSRWPSYPARRKASTTSPDEVGSAEWHLRRRLSPAARLAALPLWCQPGIWDFKTWQQFRPATPPPTVPWMLPNLTLVSATNYYLSGNSTILYTFQMIK